MRTLRLDRTFDAVFVHDAIEYMTTEADLRAAVATAYAHCRPGGVAVLVPDDIAENFEPETEHGGSDAPDGRGVRYLSWSTDPDPADATTTTDYAFLLRSPDGSVQVAHDTHALGLLPARDLAAGARRGRLRGPLGRRGDQRGPAAPRVLRRPPADRRDHTLRALRNALRLLTIRARLQQAVLVVGRGATAAVREQPACGERAWARGSGNDPAVERGSTSGTQVMEGDGVSRHPSVVLPTSTLRARPACSYRLG